MIDIRELRIGNHIIFNGTRVEVIGIEVSNDEDVPEVITVHEVLDKGEFDIPCDPCELDPIPITEELLKELGFEEMPPQNEGWSYGIEKVLTKEFDSPIEEDYFISLAQYEGGLYQLQVLGTMAYVRNLHELEQFVYLTTKQELI